MNFPDYYYDLAGQKQRRKQICLKVSDYLFPIFGKVKTYDRAEMPDIREVYWTCAAFLETDNPEYQKAASALLSANEQHIMKSSFEAGAEFLTV